MSNEADDLDELISRPRTVDSSNHSVDDHLHGDQNSTDNDHHSVSTGTITTQNTNPQNYSALPESISWRVARSWQLISENMEDIGVRFFVQMFESHPELLTLFHFGGMDISTKSQTKLPAPLKHHALLVMRTLGECVAGNIKIEDIIPKLRSIGHVHASSGVMEFHYNILFEHLMEVIEQELGPDEWNLELRGSWELTFRSLTSVIKHPDDLLEMEPLAGWGLANAVACSYIAFYTPFRMAGFTLERQWIETVFTFLTTFSAIILIIDACSHWIADQLRYTTSENLSAAPPIGIVATIKKQIRKLTFPITFRVKKFLRSLKMERWMSWRKMDATILMSFFLQHVMFLVDVIRLGPNEAWAKPATPGVHWTYVFGLLRLVAASRVFHAVHCAENNLMLRRRMSSEERHYIRILKLMYETTTRVCSA